MNDRENRYELEVALVEKAEIFTEDHGIITSCIHMNYGGSGQGAGMYGLGRYVKAKGRQVEQRACRPMYRTFPRLGKYDGSSPSGPTNQSFRQSGGVSWRD